MSEDDVERCVVRVAAHTCVIDRPESVNFIQLRLDLNIAARSRVVGDIAK
jgi:hypothetical protein